jgi:beta-1,4-mannosyl-glycoprotein beta-1,4-N-acetylglucosaminyltransferase
MKKIFDCITFFRENFITNLRLEIINDVVDYFVICESTYDHMGRKKQLNFKLNNKKFKNKIIYIVLDKPFNLSNSPWENQAFQREYIFNGLQKADPEDYIMFSDPDEIPNPNTLKKLVLDKNFGIFMQKFFCYKFNVFNQYETPWEGTRICKKKDLKSIDFMRQKIVSKNLFAPFWKIFKNKNIQIIENGGWHFNSLLSPREISIKLKTFAHKEFSSEEYSNEKIIEKNILELRDLFKRDRMYKKVELDNTFPNFILNNKDAFKNWIL